MLKKYFSELPLLWWVKFFFVIVALLFGMAFVLPSALGPESAWPKREDGQYVMWYHAVASKILPDVRLALGLDLRGGGQLTLSVELDDTVQERIHRALERVRLQLSKDGINLDGIAYQNDQIIITYEKDEDWVVIAQMVREQVEGLNPTPDVFKDEKKLIFFYQTNVIEQLKDKIMSQALQAIRERINAYGLLEPSVFAAGQDRIVVQIPGVYDPEKSKQVLGETANLDFRLLYNDLLPDQLNSLLEEALKDLQKTESLDEAIRNPKLLRELSEHLRNKEKIKAGQTILPMKVERTSQDSEGEEKETDYFYPYLVELFPRLTGEFLNEAYADQGRSSIQFISEPMVFLKFNMQGSKLFGDLTTAALESNVLNHQIAIVLDDVIISAPRVTTPITTGDAQITLGAQGRLDKKLEEAKNLAMMLRSGALPAKVKVIEERQIGPSEGQENIRLGVMSTVVGALALMLCIWLIYGNAGLVANLGMLFNVLLMLATLAAFGATLTLPGIAGIVLTMAIAVDGNVIINERIREEIRKGAGAKQAFYRGYQQSFMTILDAHLTSAVGAIVLISYGNPAMKGFAITLLIGIVSTLFTSYYFTEVLGTWLIEKTGLKRFH